MLRNSITAAKQWIPYNDTIEVETLQVPTTMKFPVVSK
jgi:hypothetical protein